MRASPKKMRPSGAGQKKKPSISHPLPSIEKQTAPDPSLEFPVVGIGASAGGLKALQAFLSQLAPDPPCAFVLVTHRGNRPKSLLPKLLQKYASVPISDLKENDSLQKGRFYICPPGKILDFRDHGVHLALFPSPRRPKTPLQLPIDSFFAALAARFGSSAVALILSGSGTDGTHGIRAIKTAGGLVLVQDPATAQFKGMPTSAVQSGFTDHILSPETLANQLPILLGPSHFAPPNSKTPPPLTRIFSLLRIRTGHDFSAYKSSTIKRRILRRIQIIQCKDWDDYAAFLEKNPTEIDALMSDLLIRVTRFFRDPEMFESLAQRVLPALIKQRSDTHPFRIWIPGCATGEEVFSLAILLREALEDTQHLGSVKIFGTDLDSKAIETARLGRFHAKDASDIQPRRLRRFFVVSEGQLQIRKEIRDHAIFALQNVIKDPPFIRLDLISCRNLLIYLTPELQAQILPLFHYALNPGGILILGSSETIGRFGDLFEVVDKKWKIFRRKDLPGPPRPLQKLAETYPASTSTHFPPASLKTRRSNPLSESLERILLQRFCPASILCTADGSVLYIHGKTGAYLEPASGHPRLNLLEMARPGLQIELASALRHAAKKGEKIERHCPEVRCISGTIAVDFTVSRLDDQGPLQGMLLVTFHSGSQSQKPDRTRSRKSSPLSTVQMLERELLSTRESLQATIEELQTSNEEFKSANEELQSTNEELQSANEEMETSKEELQSLNEELTTVNAEAEAKALELSRANDDILNLFNSTQIATLFLDNHLRIKRYAEPVRRIFRLIPSDLGRPLSDLANQLEYPSLLQDCRAVLQSLTPKTAEVRTRDGHWFLMRIMPYRTAENAVDGVVATFVDIQPVKSAEVSSCLQKTVFEGNPDPLILIDPRGAILELNPKARDLLGPFPDPLVPFKFEACLDAGSLKPFRSAFKKTLRTQSVSELHLSLISQRGTILSTSIRFLPLQNGTPSGQSVCLVLHSISAPAYGPKKDQ